MGIDRRTILAAAAASPLIGLAGRASAQATGLRPRVFGTSRPAAIEDYRRAVAAMAALPFTDARNWYRQALIHIMDCPHGNWWFLPWHRGYLARFEQICAEMCGKPDFKLPYWDYTASPTVPDVFFDPGLDPASSSFTADRDSLMSQLKAALDAWWPTLGTEALAELERKHLHAPADVIASASEHWDWGHGARRPTRQRPALDNRTASMVSIETLSTAVRTPTFTTFASGATDNHQTAGSSGLLESGPHDNVHGGTRGFMGAFMSPVDPLFWLHHANLDRLWDIWQRRRVSAGEDGMPLPANRARFDPERFPVFCDAQGRAAPMLASQCLSASALGYGYEAGSLEALASTPEPRRLASALLATSIGRRVGLREGLESSLVLSLPRSDFAPALELEDGGELIAEITLTPPSNPGDVRIRVYVNCPYLSQFTPIDDPHYVGTVSFFGALHHQGHDPRPTTFTLALGPALRALGADNRLPVSAIRVQLIPDGEGDARVLGGALDEVAIAVR